MDQVTEYFNAGLASCRGGDYHEGITFFDRALAIHPTHLESLYNRAKAKYKVNAMDACLADFNYAIEIAPAKADLYGERAVVYYRLERKKEALDDLTKAIELDLSNPYRYASRAFIKDKYGDLHGAIADYNKAIELDPEDAISYNNKGLVEEKLGLKDASIVSFRNADRLTGYKEPGRRHDLTEEPPKTPEKQDFSHVRSKEEVQKNKVSKWQIIKAIFNSREGRNEFINFVLDLLKGKKSNV